MSHLWAYTRQALKTLNCIRDVFIISILQDLCCLLQVLHFSLEWWNTYGIQILTLCPTEWNKFANYFDHNYLPKPNWIYEFTKCIIIHRQKFWHSESLGSQFLHSRMGHIVLGLAWQHERNQCVESINLAKSGMHLKVKLHQAHQ